MSLKNFHKFIRAREAVRVARDLGKAKPWTKDPILQRYRFCNVRRENDTVTRWIADNWRYPYRNDPDLWFMMAVARWVNWPDTLAEIAGPVLGLGNRQTMVFNASAFARILHSRSARGEKVWTGAYMIGTQGNAKDKPIFIAEDVLLPLWRRREELRPREGDSLESFAQRVVAVKNQGRFMVGQMIADTKYADKHLRNAHDWATWAISGPGSRRGLNRVLGREVGAPWTEAAWREAFAPVFEKTHCVLSGVPWAEELHAQDVQNCLCEFDKYERVRLGEGRPRATYRGV